MRNHLHCRAFFFALFLCISLKASASDSDVSPTDYSDCPPQYYPWKARFSNPADSSTVFSKQAAIHGDYGINLTKNIRGFFTLAAKTDFLPDFWTRFYFKYDFPKNSPTLNSDYYTSLLEISFFERAQKDQPSSSIVFQLSPPSAGTDSFSLFCYLRSSEQMRTEISFQQRVSSLQPHCVETHVWFPGKDSFAVSLYLDNVPVWQSGLRYLFPKDYILFSTFNDSFGSAGGRLNVNIDDVSVSKDRLYPLPAVPQNCSTRIDGYRAILSCAASDPEGERLAGIRYRLFSTLYSEMPIYDFISSDPLSFTTITIPFELDSGTYFWKAQSENQFRNVSDWSRPVYFTISKQRPTLFWMKPPYLSNPGASSPLGQIQPDKWYDLHFGYNPNTILKKVDGDIYALVWLHHSDYTEGNPANKGGRFLSALNYIFNLSFYSRLDILPILFEKSIENSLQSKPLSGADTGLYVDKRPGMAMFDTTRNEFKIRMKLLKNAKPGKWVLSGYVATNLKEGPFSQTEIFSNFTTSSILVVNSGTAKSFSARFLWAAVIINLSIVTALIIFKRRKYQAETTSAVINNSGDFERISEYIRNHLSEKLAVNEILSALHISRNRFYAVMTGQNQTLPEIINRLRIEKAKDLLMNNREMNIEEISQLLGYKSSNYFSTLFRSSEGTTPTEYRNQSKPVS